MVSSPDLSPHTPHAALSFWATFLREWRIAVQQKSEVFTPVFFYVMVASLFPFAVGADMAILQRIGAGVIWVGALLACMLALQRLFQSDYADGTLEQMCMQRSQLWSMVQAKVCAASLLIALPLVLIAPLLGLQFGLNGEELRVLLVSLLLGLPTLVQIGAIAAALTLGLRSAGLLMAVLCLPLFVPVLVFGAGAVASWQAGLGVVAEFSVLAAMWLVATFFAPFASAYALRLSLD